MALDSKGSSSQLPLGTLEHRSMIRALARVQIWDVCAPSYPFNLNCRYMALRIHKRMRTLQCSHASVGLAQAHPNYTVVIVMLTVSFYTCTIPMFRIVPIKAFISAKVTGFHLWKWLLDFRAPWCFRVSIRSEAYLLVQFGKVNCLHLCYCHYCVYWPVSSTNSSMVSSPKNSWKNSNGLASAENGIFRPGWAVNGNTAGGTSVAVYCIPLQGTLRYCGCITRVIILWYVC